MSLYVLCIGAHPDDAEFSVGGTAARYCQRGDIVHLISVTNGDRGHYTEEYRQDRSKLAARRTKEAANSAAVIGATWETMGIHDGDVYVDIPSTEAMIRLIRSSGPPGKGPDIVLLNRPVDYHRDHRYTAQLVLDATYMLTVPLMCPDVRHLNRMPVFAYWQDSFTETAPFRADVVVPIDDVIEDKARMAVAHESQFFEWLPFNHGDFANTPKDEEGRWQFVLNSTCRRNRAVRDAHAARLDAQYPGNTCQYAEAFQISEYGSQPSPEDLKRLFPI
ncbi:MAG: PIG-L family deacetylase [Armatimonadetes bacterium]|nr:PIG-L family deacetylase [Armatimonadota bacterium]